MILTDTDDVLIERREVPKKPRFSLLDEIYVEHGDKSDWEEFHALHYKATSLGVWPRIYRIGLNEEAIGCIVFTTPRITLSGRNTLLKNMMQNQDGRDTQIMNKCRTKWLNNHTATLSRMVLDTTYRGVGIAYRAMNIAMRMTGYDMIEFQSAMSRVNPFAQKAGVIFAKPKRNAAFEKGLMFFRRWFDSVPTDYVGIYEEFKNSLTPSEQKVCLREMQSLYYNYSCVEKSGDNRFTKDSRLEAMPTPKLIKSFQQLVFAFPMYGVYLNPDKGRTLPNRIPISMYDKTSVKEPLMLDGRNDS